MDAFLFGKEEATPSIEILAMANRQQFRVILISKRIYVARFAKTSAFRMF